MRHSKPHTLPESQRKKLIARLERFGTELNSGDLRTKVRTLVPTYHQLRDLGASLIKKDSARSAINRIGTYLRAYPRAVINGDELMVVSGIGEWARRVRQLRVERGWRIFSGVLFKEIAEDQPELIETFKEILGVDPLEIKPDQYVLIDETEDEEAADRWRMLNSIRKSRSSVSNKILDYLRRNVGREIPGDELRYLAKNATEWARRTRELRTEYGWPVKTRNSGRPDLPIGVYVLEADRQAPAHDRAIKDAIRVAVLKRDGFKCTNPKCGWHRELSDRDDPRTMLELHHIKHHKDQGENSIENLITLCNVCHDEVHRAKRGKGVKGIKRRTIRT